MPALLLHVPVHLVSACIILHVKPSAHADHATSCWDAYYSSYLQVVHRQSVTLSGYVMNSFSLASAIIGPFVGL